MTLRGARLRRGKSDVRPGETLIARDGFSNFLTLIFSARPPNLLTRGKTVEVVVGVAKGLHDRSEASEGMAHL
jgi:hypothetical protein